MAKQAADRSADLDSDFECRSQELHAISISVSAVVVAHQGAEDVNGVERWTSDGRSNGLNSGLMEVCLSKDGLVVTGDLE
jgi:hypothetical protein